MATTLYVTQNIAGTTESNKNNISITPSSPTNDYILIVFTEKNNCNNTVIALFENESTNCDVSCIDIKSVDLSSVDLGNGLVHFNKNGLWNVDIYYQSSNSNLDISNANYSYCTTLDVSPKTSCGDTNTGGDFSCEELNNCPDFNAKLDGVSTDSTLSGDGTPGNLLSVQRENGNGTQVNGNAIDLSHLTNNVQMDGNNYSFALGNTSSLLNSFNLYTTSNSGFYNTITKPVGVNSLLIGSFDNTNVVNNTSVIIGRDSFFNPNGGIRMWDSVDGVGCYYDGDYYVVGVATHGDRLVTDVGGIKRIVGELTPSTVTLTTATTFNAASGNNGTYSYNSVVDVNFTIDDDFLEDGKFAYFTTENTGDFTFVSGSGSPVLINKQGLYSSDGIHSVVTVTNVKGVYKINGDLK